MSKYLSSLHSKRYSLIRWVSIIEIFGLQAIDAKAPNNSYSSQMQIHPSVQNEQSMPPSNSSSKEQLPFSYGIPNNNQNLNNWSNIFGFPFPFNSLNQLSNSLALDPLGNFSQNSANPSPDPVLPPKPILFDDLPPSFKGLYNSLTQIVKDPNITPQELDKQIDQKLAEIPPLSTPLLLYNNSKTVSQKTVAINKENIFFVITNELKQNLLHYCASGKASPAVFSYLLKKLEPIDGIHQKDSSDKTPLDLLFRNKRFDLISECLKNLNKSFDDEGEGINKIFQTCFETLNQQSQSLDIFISNLRDLIKSQFLNSQTKNISKDLFNSLKHILSMLKEEDQDAIETLLAPDSNHPSLFILAIKEGKFDLANVLVSYQLQLDEFELNNVLNEANQYIINKSKNSKFKLSINDPLFQLIHSIIKKCEPNLFISVFRTFITDYLLDPDTKEISSNQLTFLKSILSTLEKQGQDTQDNEAIETLLAPDPNAASLLVSAIHQEKIDLANVLISYKSQLDEFELSNILDKLKDYIIKKAADNERSKEKPNDSQSQIVINASLLKLINSIIKECEPSTSFPSNFMDTLIQHASIQQLKQIIPLFSSEMIQTLLFESNENGETSFKIIASNPQNVSKLKILFDVVDNPQLIITEEKLFEWSGSDAYNSVLLALKDRTKQLTQHLTLSDEDGNSLLHIAAKNNAWKNVRTLIKAGADFTLKNQKGQNPIYLLIQKMSTKYNNKNGKMKSRNNKNNNYSDIITSLYEILKQVEKSCQSQDEDNVFQNFINEQDAATGNTLLHEIVKLPLSSEIINLLKRHDADFTIQNIHGMTPLNIARKMQSDNIRLLAVQEDAS